MHSLGVPFTLKERKLNFACEILVCGSSECPDVFEVRSFGSDERLLVVYVPPFLKHHFKSTFVWWQAQNEKR